MRRRPFFLLKIAAAAALLTVIFFMVKFEAIWEALKSAQFGLVAAGAALMPLNIWIQQRKWGYLVRLVKPEARFHETIGSLLAGLSLGIVTPGRIGEYSRALFIKDTPPLRLVGLTIIDKFYNLGIAIAVGLPALLTLPWFLAHLRGYLLFTMIGLMTIGDLILLYLALDPRPVRSLIYAIQISFPRQGRIAQLLGGLDRFSAPQARRMLLYTLAYYAVFQTQYFLFIQGFAALDPISSIRGAAATLFTKTALPIAIGDLGLDQLASMTYFGAFNVSEAAALNASMLMFTVNVLIPALAGIPFTSRLSIGSLKTKVET